MLKDIRCNTEVLKAEMEGVSAELTALVKQTERLIADNAKVARNQAVYEKKYTDLTTRYEEKKAEYDRLNGKIESAKAAGAEIDNFVEYITENGTPITEFDEELWGCMVETVTVQADGSMEFLFKSGYKVTV